MGIRKVDFTGGIIAAYSALIKRDDAKSTKRKRWKRTFYVNFCQSNREKSTDLAHDILGGTNEGFSDRLVPRDQPPEASVTSELYSHG